MDQTHLADTLVEEYDTVLATRLRDEALIALIDGPSIPPDILTEIGVAGGALAPLELDETVLTVRIVIDDRGDHQTHEQQ